MAFSAGPYGAALNDGSEYDGSYASRVSEEQMMDFHAKRLHVSLLYHSHGNRPMADLHLMKPLLQTISVFTD